MPLDGKRVMSPTSTSIQAAPEGADAVRVGQRGVGRGEQMLELFVDGLLAGVDPPRIVDQLRGDAPASLPGDVVRGGP